MAWPFDARDTTYTAIQVVASATLNDIQNKIVDAHKDVWLVDTGYHSEDSSAWTLGETEGFQSNAAYVDATDALRFTFAVRAGMIVREIEVKYNHDAASGLELSASATNIEFDVDATAPTSTVIVSGTVLAASPGAWDVQRFTALAHTAETDQRITVRLDQQGNDDKVAGVRLLVQPFDVSFS